MCSEKAMDSTGMGSVYSKEATNSNGMGNVGVCNEEAMVGTGMENGIIGS